MLWYTEMYCDFLQLSCLRYKGQQTHTHIHTLTPYFLDIPSLSSIPTSPPPPTPTHTHTPTHPHTLHLSTPSRGSRAVCLVLTEHGGDIHLQDADGDTPLELAGTAELKQAMMGELFQSWTSVAVSLHMCTVAGHDG